MRKGRGGEVRVKEGDREKKKKKKKKKKTRGEKGRKAKQDDEISQHSKEANELTPTDDRRQTDPEPADRPFLDTP
jgi:hypothetical protein